MVIALGVLFYPIVVNYFASRQSVTIVQRYNDTVSHLGANKTKKILDNAKLYNAKLYNDYIYAMSQHLPWKGDVPNYQQELKINSSGMMGYITIPQIQVRDIPIYHGDAESTLAMGVGHMQQTSLPIGGLNTHTVLAAHSGRVNNTLFTNLDKLQKGDVFYIHTFNLELKYQVINIKIVNPNQVGSLSIVKGEDLATLVTCYPTGINNKRLLVTGDRIALTKKVPSETINRNQFGYNFWVFTGSASLAFLALLWLLALLLLRRRKLYQVSLKVLKEPSLIEGQSSGTFGRGFYLTSSKHIAKIWAKEQEKTVLNVYRLKKVKEISRRIFKAKSDNWQEYVTANLSTGYEGKEYELIIGPIPNYPYHRMRKIEQYTLKSEDAMKHLKYIKSIQVEKETKKN
ncbi:class C sortase [Lactococcus nasutitermitis]|uniref:Class C sortase n=1 Tax=Lactococcus nasutitermitis TaxID=1652957 RepID=A0ABV9JE23_9LACT|nr:class C sortase [Lactococcus nasutitermitis]